MALFKAVVYKTPAWASDQNRITPDTTGFTWGGENESRIVLKKSAHQDITNRSLHHPSMGGPPWDKAVIFIDRAAFTVHTSKLHFICKKRNKTY